MVVKVRDHRSIVALQAHRAPMILAAATLMMVGRNAVAHHSVSAYDLTKNVTIEGTIKQFEWTNPHSWLEIATSEADGNPKVWVIEAGTPNVNVRMGWKKSDIHIGDRVTAVIHPKRDGAPGGTFVSLTLPSGRVIKGPTTLFDAPAGAAQSADAP